MSTHTLHPCSLRLNDNLPQARLQTPVGSSSRPPFCPGQCWLDGGFAPGAIAEETILSRNVDCRMNVKYTIVLWGLLLGGGVVELEVPSFDSRSLIDILWDILWIGCKL